MKRLAICCDGTWNDADTDETVTNVVRISRAIAPSDERSGSSIPQIVLYHSGVGTGSDLLGRVAGGGIGLGLSRNVRDAYAFIADNYVDGDEIFLFGFSRGAYTARSIAGLIGYAGLLHRREMDDFATVWEDYRLKGKPNHVSRLAEFTDRRPHVSIKCVGVWDTVGSLGIPGHIDKIFTDFYQFHDTSLGPHVQHAYHALALDERRQDFVPTLWQQTAEGKAKGQILSQVWFAGAHSNVGGGYTEHGLSDVALAWMCGQVEPQLAIDRAYLASKRDMTRQWGLGEIVDSADGFWKLRGSIVRKPFDPGIPNPTCESVHPSVIDRLVPGAACLPTPYPGSALGTVRSPVAPLSSLEAWLKWAPADSAAFVRAPHRQPALLSHLLGWLGGG